MKSRLFVLLSLVIVAGMLLTSCATPTPQVIEKVVEKPVEKVVQATVVVEKAVEKVVEKPVEKQVVVTATPAPVKPLTAEDLAKGATLPRNETMYFNGNQWNAVVCWSPFSDNCNNWVIAQGDNARELMFETPYAFNMLDGKQYPLLADGPYTWNDAKTELTFKLKPAAKWSDGTPVTAEDVAYTFATHIKYKTSTGEGNKDYIDTIIAKDPQTVVIKAKLGADGKAVNPLVVQAYVSANYVVQKAWTQKMEQRNGNDQTKVRADKGEDITDYAKLGEQRLDCQEFAPQ